MATLVKGELWDELGKADLLLVSTNSTITKTGALVMGRGAALEAAERFRELPRVFARLALDAGCELQASGRLIYGVVVARTADFGRAVYPEDWPRDLRLGAFQVKYDWREPADLALMYYSAGCLAQTIEQMRRERRAAFRHSDHVRVAMNFPGIGNGRLARSDVLSVLSFLPPCVYVYERDS